MILNDLSDQELLSALDQACFDTRRLLGRVLAYLGEVEERRLYARASYPSMYEFCIRKLGMSEGETYRRLTGARIVARFPQLLPRLTSGSLHLTALVQLRDLWTQENIDELASAVAGKSKLEIAHEIARRAPRPDVPDRVQKLPTLPLQQHSDKGSSLPAVETSGADPAPSSDASSDARCSDAPTRDVPTPARRDRIEPLSEQRFKLQFTIGQEFRHKLAQVQDLMRHRNPDGNLETVFGQALDALLAKLEREQRAKTERPQKHPRPARPGTVTAATRREVFARDGEQCSFVDPDGMRCSATTLLEIDHIKSRGKGGSSDAANLRVLCRAHNQLHAEEDYGKAHVRKHIHVREHLRSVAGTRWLAGLVHPVESAAHLRQRGSVIPVAPSSGP